ncbi:DUF819 family protein [Sulfitobacter sp. JB4-11]|uniref:DUF819 family protein n=1 Tax=Sulfitobacter rhodophyticola TaxID=3238304 RepID=UPI003D819690
MSDILFFALFIFVPLLIVFATKRIKLAGAIGAIVICYAIGLSLGLSNLLPDAAEGPRKTLSEVSLVFALPLLLFSVDLRAWGKIAGKALLSMFCAVLAVSFTATVLYFWLQARGTSDSEQFSAMAVGMYTGGVANLAAMKVALAIPDARFTLFATVDTAVGGLYLLFMLTLAKPVFGRFLRPFDATARQDGVADQAEDAPGRQEMIVSVMIALFAAGICVGLSLVLAPIISFAQFEITVIVLLTTFGLVASLIPYLRANRMAEPTGMFLIYVFTFCIAASLDLSAVIGADLTIVAFVLLATAGTVLIHALLSKLMGIDVETFVVTSVAALLSPAFVPMIVERLRNPALLMSGVSVGILGFAIGNYLGISLALVLAR